MRTSQSTCWISLLCVLLVQGRGFPCSFAQLTKGSWPVGSTQVLVSCPSAQEAGAHPASSQHTITAHSMEGQAETPEKLGKCKVTKGAAHEETGASCRRNAIGGCCSGPPLPWLWIPDKPGGYTQEERHRLSLACLLRTLQLVCRALLSPYLDNQINRQERVRL